MKITKIKNIIKNKSKQKQEEIIQSNSSDIDDKNNNEVKQLTIKNDEIENEKNNQLINERLLFIIKNSTSQLDVFSSLVTNLMKDNNKYLLETIFERYLKFFDNEMIIKLLSYYRNRIPISNSDLYKQLDNDKYKISTELNENIFVKYDSSYYLFNACLLGNKFMVKYLVEHGADIKIKDKNNRMAFSNACESGNEHLVRYLVRLGADINHEDNDGKTPLFNACWSGNENIVKYLVEHGADVNKKDIGGLTPLFNACNHGHENIVKYLVEHGADVNKECSIGTTPLFDACNYGHENIVNYLVEHGADINKKRYDGKTPLFYERKNGYENIVNYLVEHGADINKEDDNIKQTYLNPLANLILRLEML